MDGWKHGRPYARINLKNEVGAINADECKLIGRNPTNSLDFGFRKIEISYKE